MGVLKKGGASIPKKSAAPRARTNYTKAGGLGAKIKYAGAAISYATKKTGVTIGKGANAALANITGADLMAINAAQDIPTNTTVNIGNKKVTKNADGTIHVHKHRSPSPTNVHALRRSVTRLSKFEKLSKRITKSLNKLAHKHGHSAPRYAFRRRRR